MWITWKQLTEWTVIKWIERRKLFTSAGISLNIIKLSWITQCYGHMPHVLNDKVDRQKISSSLPLPFER